MNGVRQNAKIPPEKSPSLPGFSIDANVCRNPACENFGVSEQDIQSAKFGYSYKYANKVLKLQCKRCKQTHQAYSNVSALAAFHHCLAKSIPYASCPNSDCKNHYVNLFEHYHDDPRDKRDRLYRVNVSDDVNQNYQARCRSCDSTFTLSKPLRLHTSEQRTWQKAMDTFIHAIVDGSGPSNVMNQMRIRAVRYYSQLKAASNALSDYNNYHLINLMKPSVAPESLEIYTDSIICSIKSRRNNMRQHPMKIIVSTCVQNNRSLILAFHPLFFSKKVDDHAIADDHKQPIEKRRFAHLKHPFNTDKDDTLAPLGVGGCFMEEFYAYLGHFLVLRKMLANVPSLQFYMDGERHIHNAALNAFSDRIKSGSCDVVIRIMEKEKKGSQSRMPGALSEKFEQVKTTAERAYRKAYPDAKRPSLSELRKFSLSEEMKRVNEAIKTTCTKEDGTTDPERLKKIYSMATRWFNKSGKEFWAVNRISDKYSPESRMFWLTRTAERSNSDNELNLYLNGSNLFYIDHVFGAFRQRSSMAARPGTTATNHKSYNRNPELPGNLAHDFTINVAFWNFFLKYRSEQKETIAYAHGLVRKPDSPDTRVIFQPLYTFENAKRISKWLGT